VVRASTFKNSDEVTKQLGRKRRDVSPLKRKQFGWERGGIRRASSKRLETGELWVVENYRLYSLCLQEGRRRKRETELLSRVAEKKQNQSDRNRKGCKAFKSEKRSRGVVEIKI